jgi:hypothetical protein
MIPNELNGQRVTVHYNLHKSLWSITHKGRVVAHVSEVPALVNAKMNYGAALHAKVVEKGCRKVYLKVSGILDLEYAGSFYEEVHANPYRNGGTFTRADGSQWTDGPAVHFPQSDVDATKGAGFLMI